VTRTMATKTVTGASTALLAAGLLTCGISLSAWAQGAPQTVGLVKVDPQTVETGFRGSKLIGASIINDANDTIGKIDDLIVSADGKIPYVVLSVGGFIGIGDRLVVVSYSNLRFADNKIVLPGGNKEELRALPEFKYAKD
jgi:hypothetical protein